MRRWIALLLCAAMVCSAIVISALAASEQETQPRETETEQELPDTQSAWYYCASLEADLGHSAVIDSGTELWLEAETGVPDGFSLYGGSLCMTLSGRMVKDCSGQFGGVDYRCDADGVCTVTGRHTLLPLSDGTICVLKNGTPWRSRGFFEYQGNCYYGTENGTLFTNGIRDGMQFDSVGRYTSGNAQIDTAVRQLIADVTDDSMTQDEKLRACYDAVCAKVYYQANNRRVAHGAPAEDWTEDAMLRLLQRGRGNCYCYAAQMYYIARQLGYADVRAVSGQDAPDGCYIDHGWTELTVDGVAYILDPEMERMRRCRKGRLFMVTYDDAPWLYDPCNEKNG